MRSKYSVKKTAVKAALPSVVVLAGARALTKLFGLVDIELGEAQGMEILVLVYSFGIGVANWIKNR